MILKTFLTLPLEGFLITLVGERWQKRVIYTTLQSDTKITYFCHLRGFLSLQYTREG
ncbi:hypothetical protein E2C01_015466 [Portunus trituberculatus]|uniref:Uncharacterized protein n=1 Tax=Portunus trituberculatus TaxID=210409 RepID=A0A5B7DLL3_PORTR|nr:hypothetical protein [Portunus trituberculatus]